MATRIELSSVLAGAFVGLPELKTVKYSKDGNDFEFDVYIRKLSYQSAVNDGKSLSKNPDALVAGRIAACVVDVAGKPVFESVDQVMGLGKYASAGPLNEDLSFALYTAVKEVNYPGKLISTTNPSSGVNWSSTGSGVELLTKPSDRLPSQSSESGTPIEHAEGASTSVVE